MKTSEIAYKCCLNENEQQEYKSYLENEFVKLPVSTERDYSSLEKWKNIYSYALANSSAEAINRFVTAKRPVEFKDSNGVEIEIYKSFAGEIPVIYIKDNSDFELFVTNAVYKGIRPDNLSETGASFAFGKTTRYIILSAKPYSNVEATQLGLPENEWCEKSMIIRREHECTHYFTKLTFGLSRTHLHDELIADFFGIYEAFGEYKAKHFQRFMGIDGSGEGRLKFYTANLSDKMYSAVAETARSASEYLEVYSKTEDFLQMSREQRVMKLCQTGLADMCNA